jgi:hypothetical protein
MKPGMAPELLVAKQQKSGELQLIPLENVSALEEVEVVAELGVSAQPAQQQPQQPATGQSLAKKIKKSQLTPEEKACIIIEKVVKWGTGGPPSNIHIKANLEAGVTNDKLAAGVTLEQVRHVCRTHEEP